RDEKKRSLWASGNEGRGLHVKLHDGMGEARALQHAGKIGDDARAPTGDRGTILAIPHIACAQFSRAAADRREPRATNERRKFSAEDFITETKFAAPAAVIADIETSAGSLIAENSDPGLTGECVAGQLGSEGIGRDEKMSIAKRLIKLRSGQVARPKLEVVTPFAA